MRFLRNLGLVVFLTVSGTLLIEYFAALYDKVLNPGIKNMTITEFLWLSPVAAGLMVVDYFIIRRIIRWIKDW